jgi:hypothetical protein
MFEGKTRLKVLVIFRNSKKSTGFKSTYERVVGGINEYP